MSLKSRIIFLFIFSAAISCNQNISSLSEDEKQIVISEARAMLQDYHTAISGRGLEAEFEYLDNSPAFFWVPPGYSGAISYDSVAAVLRRNAPLLKSVTNAWDTLRVQALAPGLASYTGRLLCKTTDTSGNTTETRLVETGLLIKRASGWKLMCGQTNVIQ